MIKPLFALALLAAPVAASAAVPARVTTDDKDLSAVYVAMNDAPGVAKDVYDLITARKIAVSFAYMTPPFAGGPAPRSFSFETGGSTEIMINEEVPAEPQAVAPLLAREVAPLLLADMPECAEKSYMRRSYEVRAWREMGGSPAGLPVIEAKTGWSDQPLADAFKLWLDNDAQTAVDKIGAAAGTKTIYDQTVELNEQVKTMPPASRAYAEAQGALKKLAAADVRFVKFVLAEKDWRAAHP